jgi:glycerol-3-phosphate acyltransferase PlsY
MAFGILAVVIAYLLGSIPSAYLATRLAVGKDIRRLGGGNVGGLNVYREVGFLPAMCSAIFDLSKGAGAVAIAIWALKVDEPYILATAVAVVVGHNWMLFLKFSGGKGMGPTMGSLLVLLPFYGSVSPSHPGYPLGLAIFFAIALVLFIISRNVALSMGAGIVALPFIGWLGVQSAEFVIYASVLLVVVAIKFFPTAKPAIARARNLKAFIFDRGKGEQR